MAELWDLYDDERKPLNRTHIRGEQMAKGTRHIVVEIWTFNSKNELLLTKRDPRKTAALKWECTGGSVISGETSIKAAKRELFEETGISAEENELSFIIALPSFHGTAFFDEYVLHKDVPIEAIRLQEGETIDAKWVSAKEFLEMEKRGELCDSAIINIKNVVPEWLCI